MAAYRQAITTITMNFEPKYKIPEAWQRNLLIQHVRHREIDPDDTLSFLDFDLNPATIALFTVE
jgi:hypothetical protein